MIFRAPWRILAHGLAFERDAMGSDARCDRGSRRRASARPDTRASANWLVMIVALPGGAIVDHFERQGAVVMNLIDHFSNARRSSIDVTDTHLVNQLEEILSSVYRAKYKLQNLQ